MSDKIGRSTSSPFNLNVDLSDNSSTPRKVKSEPMKLNVSRENSPVEQHILSIEKLHQAFEKFIIEKEGIFR